MDGIEMIVSNGKWRCGIMMFNKFPTEEIVTWLTFDIMKRKENFVMIIGNNPDILSEREYQEWLNNREISIHEIAEDEHEIILFTKQNGGYALHYNHYAKDVLIPDDLLQLKYNDFLERTSVA